MKRIIITGASGFIGKYITERLWASGYEIVEVDRHSSDIRRDGNIQIISELSGNASIDYVLSKIENADVFVHAAADITVPGEKMTVGNNIDSMWCALEIAKKTGVKHFVYLSSVPVIGKIENQPITEEHAVQPLTLYHWSKYLGEKMLENYKEYFETTTILRIPSPIGVGMNDNVFLSMLLRKMLDDNDVEIYGNGERIQNYIDVRDIANAFQQVIVRKPEGLYLIAGKHSISNRRLVELCKELTSSNSTIISGKHIDNSENEQWILSCRKSEESFGYCPRYKLEDTIRWIYEDMKK